MMQLTHVEDVNVSQASAPSCVSCGARGLRHYYQIDRQGQALKCFRCILRHRPRVVTSLKTAAVVGSILVLINQSDALLRGAVTSLLVLKMALTYSVPYMVSTYGALMASQVESSEL